MMTGSMLTKQNFAYKGWLLLILLTAVLLRLLSISDIPPGLTHDEADHGVTAVSILEGSREIYFSVGHGREPLYDYVTAMFMTGVGQTFLAGRLTAVYAGLILIAGMAAWVRKAFDGPTAVLTAAGLAVGFWPLMAARQSLRSILLPAIFVFVVFFFWRGLMRLEIRDWRLSASPISNPSTLLRTSLQSPISSFLIAGIMLGITFYTYIPARVLWLVFPLTWGYAWLAAWPLARQSWCGILLMLFTAALIGVLLFTYLQTHPEAEVRIRELSGPLTAVTEGNVSTLWENAQAGLGILTFTGDDFWRYNIPGRPLLPPLMGLLFGVGLVVAVWFGIRPFLQKQRPYLGTASFLALGWLAFGLAPVLVTGSHLSMTRAMGMQPVLYLFPALAIREIGRYVLSKTEGLGVWRLGEWWLYWAAVGLLFVGTAVFTVRDYFVIWANEPEVRVQYETAMATAMRYLNGQEMQDVAVSTITPGQYHSPAVATMMLTNEDIELRWFDGRSSLLLPNSPQAGLILSGFASLPDGLTKYWDMDPVEIIPQPESDRDRPLAVYQFDVADWLAEHEADFTAVPPTQFGEAAVLRGYDLQTTAVVPGETVRLITMWQLGQPVEGIRLFTHLSAADGVPFAQADGLDAPGEAWQTGDYLLQLHEFVVPVETAASQYSLTIGLYTCLDITCNQTQRFPILANNQPAGDQLYLQNLTVTE
ncbi:MAG: hypothetical protein GY796_33670 [Chloroflexi bacterium]|nr:hypothetical protein [Chloroflexota bacterium]